MLAFTAALLLGSPRGPINSSLAVIVPPVILPVAVVMLPDVVSILPEPVTIVPEVDAMSPVVVAILPVLTLTPVDWNWLVFTPVPASKSPSNCDPATTMLPVIVPLAALILPFVNVTFPSVLVISPVSITIPALLSKTAVVITSSVLNLPSRGVV